MREHQLRPLNFDEWLKLVGVIGALISFLWSVHQWRDKAADELRQAKSENDRLAKSRKIEATKPFLEKQLGLYTETLHAVAVLSTTTVADERAKATKLFWELYFGEMAIVENREVEAAMVGLGRALKRGASQADLQDLALTLDDACRKSLDRSWGIHAWTSPDDAAK